MTKHEAGNLMAAVAKARSMSLDEKPLNINKFDDRLIMQKGCFLLNHWDVRPKYSFRLYIRGPYSSELADDYYELHKSGFKFELYSTDIDSSLIENLSKIMSKGTKYLEAYSTLILARSHNPTMGEDTLKEFVLRMKPALKKEIEEVSGSQLFR